MIGAPDELLPSENYVRKKLTKCFHDGSKEYTHRLCFVLLENHMSCYWANIPCRHTYCYVSIITKGLDTSLIPHTHSPLEENHFSSSPFLVQIVSLDAIHWLVFLVLCVVIKIVTFTDALADADAD